MDTTPKQPGHGTGDAIKMSEAIRAKTNQSRVDPGTYNRPGEPDDPVAKIQFLSTEAFTKRETLSAVHLSTCLTMKWGDGLTGEMWRNNPSLHLAVNKAVSDEFAWHFKNSTGRRVLKYNESCAALAQDMGVPANSQAHCTPQV